MALQKLKDFDPNYRDQFNHHDIKELDLYSGDQKIGSVEDALVDENGQFRYLVIHTGMWILGKKVLLPIGRARIDYPAHRVNADTLTKEQVEALPELTDDMTVDYDHEERVRGVYRSSSAADGVGYAGSASAPATANAAPPIDLEAGYAGYDRGSQPNVATTAAAAAGVGYAGSASAPATSNAPLPLNLEPGYAGYDRATYTYEQDPDLYEINERDHQSLKQYQSWLASRKMH
ncbi:MAG TPA: PRC-barrel domain-containing protein [Coleofasciculaceae cyanobacterium]